MGKGIMCVKNTVVCVQKRARPQIVRQYKEEK